MWGGTHGVSPLNERAEDGILAGVQDFDEPDGHVLVTMELGGKKFRGRLPIDDAAFREKVYQLLKQNIGRSIREAGDLHIQG
jgi:hypothetical protein